MATRERPILFSGPMVRAILEGRKTQTRRVYDCTLYPGSWARTERRMRPYPHGAPGDRLWVREAWRPSIAHGHGADACDCADVRVAYAADGADRFFDEAAVPSGWVMPEAARRGYVPSIHMPRWASRLTLEITDVRVQRLQDISEADAKAEGIYCYDFRWFTDADERNRFAISNGNAGDGHNAPSHAFRHLWDRINGKRAPWANNPYVWAITFRRVEP